MLRNQRLALALALASVLPGAVYAATVNLDVKALVIQAITLTKNADLDFGKIALQGTAGSVVVAADATGTITATGLTHMGSQIPGDVGITAEPGQAFTVSLPTSVSLGNGTSTITADTFTHNAPASLTGSTGTFKIGGKLTFTGTETAGSYVSSAPLVVTVNYN